MFNNISNQKHLLHPGQNFWAKKV